MKKKAVVAMSGGVDSSVTAALLVEEGYDVTGIMLKLWKGEAANNNSGCCNLSAAEDARRVTDRLGIPFYVFNFADLFERTVIRDFQSAYLEGQTPNPCVRCNQWIKFDALLERARALGADVLATGHYARVRSDGDAYRLYRGADKAKDQSYVLWMLGQEELAHCRFPVGEMTKNETRAIAAELGLRTAQKPDSQEICFVRGGDTRAYIDEQLPGASIPGPILDSTGRVVGTHRGVGHYTIGQRKGLGISLGMPLFVSAIDAAANSVTIGGRDDLRVAAFRTSESSFVSDPTSSELRVIVQHRAHGETHWGTLVVNNGSVEVTFDDPVTAVAPGQSAAFYLPAEDGMDELVGGGVITETLPVEVAA